MSDQKLRRRIRQWQERAREYPSSRPLSRVLMHFAAYEPLPSSIGRLRDKLADRGLATLLLLAGAINLLPLPLGATLISGTPAMLLAWQLMLKRQVVWLPQRLLQQPLTERHMGMLRQRIVPRLFWLEKVARPRYWPFDRGQDDFLVGLLCLWLAVILIVPLPLAQWGPAITITLLALALLQRDGVLLLAGVLAVLISTAIFFMVLMASLTLAENVLPFDFSGMLKDSPGG